MSTGVKMSCCELAQRRENLKNYLRQKIRINLVNELRSEFKRNNKSFIRFDDQAFLEKFKAKFSQTIDSKLKKSTNEGLSPHDKHEIKSSILQSVTIQTLRKFIRDIQSEKDKDIER